MTANATDKSIKREVELLKGKTVCFTEKHGQKRVRFKGVLTETYDQHAIISLDQDIHNYDKYSFSYIHIFMGEGYLKPWDKELDAEILMKSF